LTRTTEGTGKTIDEAINAALRELGIAREQAESIEIIDKPKSGLLGLFTGGIARARVTYSHSRSDIATEFLAGLFARMGVDAGSETGEGEDGQINVTLTGPDVGILIGSRGETLDAIQYITNFIVNRQGEERVRVVLDSEGYRQKREESLARLARKTAGNVVKARRSISLEPMNAYERHVIHAALQEWRDVSTASTGVDPNRRIVVSYTPGGVAQPENDRRPPRQGGGRGTPRAGDDDIRTGKSGGYSRQRQGGGNNPQRTQRPQGSAPQKQKPGEFQQKKAGDAQVDSRLPHKDFL